MPKVKAYSRVDCFHTHSTLMSRVMCGKHEIVEA